MVSRVIAGHSRENRLGPRGHLAGGCNQTNSGVRPVIQARGSAAHDARRGHPAWRSDPGMSVSSTLSWSWMEASLAGRDVERRRRAVSDGAVVERHRQDGW